MAENIAPTRSNLLQRRDQLQLARRGADLLKRKRDALIGEFFDLVKASLEARRGRGRLGLFLLDQALHLATLGAFWIVFRERAAAETRLPALAAQLDALVGPAIVAAAYATNVHGAGAVVGGVLRHFRLQRSPDTALDVSAERARGPGPPNPCGSRSRFTAPYSTGGTGRRCRGD